MAFNPFHAFRKHQKKLLAGVTVLAMVTFILSSGTLSGGDFFGEMLRLFGGEGRVAEAATLYGRRVSQQELALVRQQRLLASQYMTMATQTAFANVHRELMRSLDKDKALQQELQQALLFMSFPEYQRQSLNQLNLIRMRLEGAGQKREAELLGQFMLLSSQQMARALRGQGDLYFGGQDQTEDLLDFLIWRHQADRLGIQLTTADLRSEIERETLGQLTNENKIALQQQLRRDQQSAQMLPAALGDEFRVRLAQAALLGEHPGTSTRIPAPVTPYDFWQYFRKNRTEVSAVLLPIPVQDFVAKVEDEPAEKDLKDLFAKYKEVEYTPDSPTPGFKQPRRVQVEWVAVNPDSAHYRQATTIAAAAIQATWPGAWNARLLDEYESVKYYYRLPPLNEPNFVLATHTLMARPVDVAGMIGLAAAPVDLSSSVVSAIVVYQGTTVLREGKDLAPILAKEAQRRVPGAVTQVLAGFGAAMLLQVGSPLTGFLDPLAMLAAGQSEKGKDQFLPYAVLQRRVLARVQEGLTKELIQNALATLKKEIETRKSRPEEARKYVTEAIRQYELQRHGSTTQPRDRYDISSDKGLEPLKEAYLRPPALDPKGKNFAELFFRTPSSGLYTPDRWPSEGQGVTGDGPVFLYWRTEDKPARVPDFTEVKDQVAQAWRFEKARALARAKAKEVEEQVRKQAGDVLPTLKEVGDKNSWTPFDLFAVSRIQDKPSAVFGPKQYEFYRVPEDKVEYPSNDFVDRLLGLKDKGEVTVLHNNPESIYYVTALTQPAKEPSPLNFYFAYKDAASTTRPDPLLSQRELEQRQQYYRAFLEQLRAQAQLSINEEMRRRSKDGDPGGALD